MFLKLNDLMNELGSEILKKYGTTAVVVAVISAFLIWLLAHWAAEPGREVSVLWGFVKYTKSSPTSTVRDTSVPSQPPSTVRDTSVSSPPQKSKEEDNKQSSSGSLPQSGPFIKTGVGKENRSAILKSLRNDRNLRELTAVESGKKIQELPAGTYFFILSGIVFNPYPGESLLKRVSELRADRFPSNNDYFEMQNTREGELHLIAYVNELNAAEISKPATTTTREIMVSPHP